MESGALLEVNNLVTTFASGEDSTASVKGISFSINAGETIGLVGESGSGKSVTSLSVMRLLSKPGRIAGGEINFRDKSGNQIDLAKAGADEIRELRGNEIAMIFQEPMTSLNPVMRCGEQVMEAILLHSRLTRSEARKKTIDLFSEVQLPSPEEAFAKYPHQLSGGQKQRVMIAMAMSCEPRLLIADEPTTALDVTVQKTILGLMKELQVKHGMGILFITHDLGVIAELADKVLVMYKGEIVEQGVVTDVFRDPKHPYTKALLACRPPLHAKPTRLPVVADFMSQQSTSRPAVKETQDGRIQKDESKERKKLLQLINVHTLFPGKKNFFGRPLTYTRAVDDVSFDVYEGETLGLVGESGCGKTTLGRSILKLAPVSSGEILYEGESILRLKERDFRKKRREMQIIFQDPYSSLNPRITIGEAIAEPLRVHRVERSERACKQRVYDLLSKVGLEERHYSRYPHEFSGGQRQRICIARALALNPKFIICDESVSALDVSVQAQVLNLLNDLKREFRFTCIFISHDLGVVKYMSDRMVVMRRGKIEETGDPAQMYANPKSEYTRQLISSIPQVTLENLLAGNNSKRFSA
jgi:peptide/nickel transport system ATP-binding protein